MADFDTGDVVRLGCVQQLSGLHDIVNILHVQITSGGGLAFAAAGQDFQEYCDALFNTIATRITTTQLPQHISITNVTQGQTWGNIAWNAYAGGAYAQDPTAAQVCLLAWGRTNLSRVQIRKYLGVFCEPGMTLGKWLSSERSLAQNFIDYHIVGQVMTNGMTLRGCAYNYGLDRVTFAVSGTTSEVPVIQRRRRLGRGS